MRAHRYTACYQKLDRRREPGAAFDLDHLSAGLHQANGVVERRLRCSLVAAKRHIGDQPCALQTAHYGAHVILDVFDSDRKCRCMSLNDHSERVADQHAVDAAVVEQPGEARFIAGEHCDRLPSGTHLRKLQQRYRLGHMLIRRISAHAARLKYSRRPRILSTRVNSSSKSSARSIGFRCSVLTISTGASS